ncbi:MAG: response regulator [Lachnospiraceae bacterium]|nr:response regulator [Lachnospiraceae bacterium]
MYKVVIVDDDPIVVKGLSELIPWKKYDCEVVGTAENGQEGLAMIRRLHPHMIFSDIHMPKMDGLTMAAALRSEYEDTELTILTEYRNFELAQQAIRLGVTRFLLKPSNMEELEEAVAAMALRLKKKGITGQQGASSENAGSLLVEKALEYMRENYQHRVTLTDVAESVYVSQWHMSRLLNRHTGKSFSELMNSIRIEEAKKLLADPSLRIGDIAEMTGFQDMAHFSRVFRKLAGISANEYRKLV